MIKVDIDLFPSSCLRRLEMEGHIGSEYGPAGSNLACAAITGLVRSCAEAVVGNRQLEVTGGAEAEGVFQLEVEHLPEDQRAWLQGVTDVLMSGLQRMQHETPGEISLRARVMGKQERTHGT